MAKSFRTQLRQISKAGENWDMKIEVRTDVSLGTVGRKALWKPGHFVGEREGANASVPPSNP